MIRRMLIALMSLTAILQSTMQAGVWDSLSQFFTKSSIESKDSLRILITHDTPGVILEVKGKYKIYDPNTQRHMGKGYSGKRKFIQPLSDGIKWGEEFPGVYQILVMPDDKSTTMIVDGIEYKGSIYVYDIGGSISVVNEIPFDEYVKMVLSSKLQQPLPQEALAALAIAIRTNAYYLQQNSQNNFWDVEARQIGYQGSALYNPSSLMEQAVKATHNMVMNESSLPMLIQWDIVDSADVPKKTVLDAKISLDQAAMLAHQGDHAAQILKKAFPSAQIELVE